MLFCKSVRPFWLALRGSVCLWPLFIFHRWLSIPIQTIQSKTLVCFQHAIIEGGLEVKLPTIWTDEKAEAGRIREEKRREKRREEKKKEDQRRERAKKEDEVDGWMDGWMNRDMDR